MLWPHPYQLIATPHMRTEETTLNDKAKIKLVQQQPNLPLCGGLRNYEDIKTAATSMKPACWIQHCWSWLQQLWSVSYGFVGILYSSRLILLNSDHLVGRQTVENHLVQMGTNSLISSPDLSAFFRGFYFCGSRFVHKNRENLHPVKISRYTIFQQPCAKKSSRKFTLDTWVLQNAERGLDIQYGGLEWDESWKTLSANALSVPASTSYSMLNPCVQVAFLIIHGRESEQICSSGNRQHTCS